MGHFFGRLAIADTNEEKRPWPINKREYPERPGLTGKDRKIEKRASIAKAFDTFTPESLESRTRFLW